MILETRIAHIEAKDEIRELTARYCHAVVDGDAQTIVSLFAVDGVFKTHTFAPRGHEELLAFYAAGVGGKLISRSCRIMWSNFWMMTAQKVVARLKFVSYRMARPIPKQGTIMISMSGKAATGALRSATIFDITMCRG